MRRCVKKNGYEDVSLSVNKRVSMPHGRVILPCCLDLGGFRRQRKQCLPALITLSSEVTGPTGVAVPGWPTHIVEANNGLLSLQGPCQGSIDSSREPQ